MSNATSQERIPQLDGLRGLAILLVFGFHSFYNDPSEPYIFALLGRWFSTGWSGVDLFFVLSGFLIGGILLDARDSPNYFRTFYIRRFFRIIPLYYAWTLVYVPVVAVLFLLVRMFRMHVPNGFVNLPVAEIGVQFLFLQSFFYQYGSTLAATWFLPTWSLAVEEQFYLLMPLAVRRLSRRGLVALLIAVMMFAPALRALLYARGVEYGTIYVLMPCRADALALGVLIALLWRDPNRRRQLESYFVPLCLACAAFGFGSIFLISWDSSTSRLSPLGIGAGFSFFALFYGSLLLLLLLRPSGPLGWLAGRRWLREIGRVSYCIYLIHISVLLFCAILLKHVAPQLGHWLDLVGVLLSMIMTYAIARLSWTFFERHMLQRGHAFHYSPPNGTV